MASQKIYDIVLWGASGYTGLYTAEHITDAFPTDLSWAIAGRSQYKMEAQLKELKKRNPNRTPPSVEIAELKKDDMHALAKKTKVIINCVGPYMLYGEPVIEACAANGTHYVDVTGETPWTRDMLRKYDSLAKKSGAIIIPQSGLESAVPDLMTYKLVKHIRTATSFPTKEVVHAIHTLDAQASGGTLSTILTLFEKYKPLDVRKSLLPNSMTSQPPPKPAHSPSLVTRLIGARSVPDLGTVTTSVVGQTDVAIIYRSWDLFSKTSDAYGPNFSFTPQMIVRNTFLAALVHFAGAIAPLFLLLSPVRWLLRKMIYAPGTGRDREDAKREVIELRAMAYPDGPSKDKVFGRMRFEGSMYYMTGILLSEAAGTILYGEDVPAKAFGGGVLTPATLGQAYLDRLEKGGVIMQAKTLTW